MQKKIIIAVILYVVIISLTLGVISYLALHESIERSMRSRLALARTIANYVEVFLNNNFSRLHDISLSGNVTLKDADRESTQRLLEAAYKYSLFTEGVFLLDSHGNEVLTYPPRIEYFSNLTYIDNVNQVLQHGKPVISNVFTIEPIKKKVIFMMTPLRDGDGRIVGVVGGILGPTDRLINQLLQSAKVDKNTYIEIIDSNEVIVASANPSRVFQSHSHNSALSRMILEGEEGTLPYKHILSDPDSAEKQIDRITFVPLSLAKWGVIVGQSEEDIFAPATGLEKKFLFLVLIFIGTAIIFAIGMSMNIVRPLRSLISSTDKIASGDLSAPIEHLGSDEILTLSKRFDIMREKLSESLNDIQRHNIELEDTVLLRTLQIRQGREKVESLLKQVISSQEEERKRIARGLHDDILQDLSAFLIKLDICRLYPDQLNAAKIEEMRSIALTTIDGIHNVIQNMRPSILDDLGLGAAIKWLVDKHLGKKGIHCYLTIKAAADARFDPYLETTLFRIIQEAIINIARHAGSENVFVMLRAKEEAVSFEIEDDGEGFDAHSMLRYTSDGGRGLGLLGMKERALLIDGRLEICSWPGNGTRISLRIPLRTPLEENV
jgi:signal transduction histidine kinase